jgi:TonB-linked SusC/RagA family outer membrane protein
MYMQFMKIFCFCFLLFNAGIMMASEQQGKKITGTIVDENGETVIGANVTIKGTSSGSVTDLDGHFELLNVQDNQILQISYIGYNTQEIRIGNQTHLNITLAVDQQALDEVVVVGYGTQRKKELTGSVSSLKSNDILKVAANSFTNAIQGKIPGVQISQMSGAPGAGSAVRIRGIGTTSGNDPLYVIDGMPIGSGNMSISGSSDNIGGLSVINPNDIESIEVLKDAAAAAIYGARAANGVILITTKRGSEGLAKVNYNTHVGMQQLWKKPEFLNATEFATLANELFANSNMEPNPEFANPEALGKGTDWIDAIFRTAMVQNHDLSVSGGTKNTQASLSLGYLDQDGTLIETWYKRYTGRLTVDLTANDYLKFGATLSFAYTEAKGQRNQELRVGIFNLAQQMYPHLGLDDVIDGSTAYYTSQADNPVMRAKSIDNRMSNLRMFGNAFGEVQIIKGLKFRSSIGIDALSTKNTEWQPKVERGHYRNLQAILTDTNRRGLNWLIENTLTYSGVFDDHRITALVGQTAQKNQSDNLSSTGRDYINETIQVINGSNSSERTSSGDKGEYTLASYLGRINYSFKDRYLFSASIRRDGSSNFGPKNKWGVFPSASVGWNMSEENFMKKIDYLYSLKLRASWGQLGNDDIGSFGYFSTVRIGNSADNYILGPGQGLVVGSSILKPGNPDLKWEASEQLNFGLDASFLNGQVTFGLDYYIKKTKDMLVALPVSYEAGFQTAPSINGGTIENKGLEVVAGYRGSLGDFSWGVSANVATLSNKVTSLGIGLPIVGSSVSSYITLPATYTEVGEEVGYFKGYIVDGIYQSDDEVDLSYQPNARAGDFKFRDINKDGVLSDADKVKIGSPWPNFMYGASVDLQYKGFDMNIALSGISGNDIFNANKINTYPMKYFGGSGVVNASKETLNRWTPGSGRNEIPRLVYNDANGNYANSSTFYIEDGSYMRIRNVTLGYTVPADLIRKTRIISNLRVYVSAQNLFTFTNYSGFDPEVGSTSPLKAGVDDGVYPVPRTWLMGLNVSF